MAGEGVPDLPGLDIPDLEFELAFSLCRGGGMQFKLTLISLSSAPVARYLPSGLKQTLRMYKSPLTSMLSSWRTQILSPVATS